jgi:hypothetical protein
MWLFTKYGFFSVVNSRRGFGEFNQPVDPDRLMIRSRSRKHLEHLQERFPTLKDRQIETFPGSDYPFRIFVEKSVWAEVMQELAEELDYDNFKGAVAKEPNSSDYEECLHDVWAIMRRLEKS